MDDFILIHHTKDQLLTWKEEIQIFLEKELNLRIHPKKQILDKTINGINFCGYIVKPNYILIRKRTIHKRICS